MQYRKDEDIEAEILACDFDHLHPEKIADIGEEVQRRSEHIISRNWDQPLELLVDPKTVLVWNPELFLKAVDLESVTGLDRQVLKTWKERYEMGMRASGTNRIADSASFVKKIISAIETVLGHRFKDFT